MPDRDRLARVLCIAQGCRDSENEMARADEEVAAILSDIRAQGYRIVPEVPTERMIAAGIAERHDQPVPEAWSLATANIYTAMLNAEAPDEP